MLNKIATSQFLKYIKKFIIAIQKNKIISFWSVTLSLNKVYSSSVTILSDIRLTPPLKWRQILLSKKL